MTATADPLAFPTPTPGQWRVLLPGDLPAPCTCTGSVGEPECSACVAAATAERATWERLAAADDDEGEDDPDATALAADVRAEVDIQER